MWGESGYNFVAVYESLSAIRSNRPKIHKNPINKTQILHNKNLVFAAFCPREDGKERMTTRDDGIIARVKILAADDPCLPWCRFNVDDLWSCVWADGIQADRRDLHPPLSVGDPLRASSRVEGMGGAMLVIFL